jgi:ABC-type glycerol-3-phosphate transport system substrate-binding protein
VLVALLLLVAGVAMGTGKVEATAPVKLTMVWTGDSTVPYKGSEALADTLYAGQKTWSAWLMKKVAETVPGVTVEFVTADISTGTTVTMDSLIAAGNPPDLYYDAPMRVGKYMVPGFALPLDTYLTATERAQYSPSVLAAFSRGGKLLGMPMWGWATAVAVNLDILNKAGMTMADLKPGWTTDTFLTLAEKAKAQGAWVTYLFAANQSSDQWWMNWFYAFGAKMYAPGDYSKTTLNSPEGVAALKFLKSLIDKGYAPPNSAEASDDDALNWFALGKIAIGAMQAGHTAVIDEAAKQGSIPKAFSVGWTSFPRGPGVTSIPPVAAGVSGIVVHQSKDEARNKAAAAVAKVISGKDAQTIQCYNGGYPTMPAVPFEGSAYAKAVSAIFAQVGAMDLGILNSKFSAVRAQLYPLLQEFYAGKGTAEKVLADYEAAVNAILAK